MFDEKKPLTLEGWVLGYSNATKFLYHENAYIGTSPRGSKGQTRSAGK